MSVLVLKKSNPILHGQLSSLILTYFQEQYCQPIVLFKVHFGLYRLLYLHLSHKPLDTSLKWLLYSKHGNINIGLYYRYQYLFCSCLIFKYNIAIRVQLVNPNLLSRAVLSARRTISSLFWIVSSALLIVHLPKQPLNTLLIGLLCLKH